MEHPTKINLYLSDFIRQKGGVETVARETDLQRQTIRQIYNGRNNASDRTIRAFVTAYLDFDPAQVHGVVSITKTAPVSSAIIVEVEMLRAELRSREAMIDTLRKENDRVWGMLELSKNTNSGGKRAKSFREATDLSPAGQNYRKAHPGTLFDRTPAAYIAPIGFGRGDSAGALVARPND